VLRQNGGLSEGRHYNRAEDNECTKALIVVVVENETDEAVKNSDERRFRFPHKDTLTLESKRRRQTGSRETLTQLHERATPN